MSVQDLVSLAGSGVPGLGAAVAARESHSDSIHARRSFTSNYTSTTHVCLHSKYPRSKARRLMVFSGSSYSSIENIKLYKVGAIILPVASYSSSPCFSVL